jgi:murein L,D-transpeptidase YafK
MDRLKQLFRTCGSWRPQRRRPDGTVRFWAGRLGLTACALAFAAAPVSAVTVELKDVAADRIERQRAEAIGQIPLPNTPNVGQFNERLAEKKMTLGSAIFVRIFKAESELEIWMQRGDRFELFATYPICHWSGTLGPKLTEGDKQSPEGIYSVTSRQLHLIGRHPRSLNLGFPNALDRSFSRTGSYILVHGGCSSVGCFAMTNPVIAEIYQLSQAALAKGQPAIQVQVMPFRLTEERLRAHALSEWYDFWRNMKDAYDSFERTRLPPQVTVCEGRYWIDDALKPEEVASHGPLAVCAISQDIAGLQSEEPDNAASKLTLGPPPVPRLQQISLLPTAELQVPVPPRHSQPPLSQLSTRANNRSSLLTPSHPRSLQLQQPTSPAPLSQIQAQSPRPIHARALVQAQALSAPPQSSKLLPFRPSGRLLVRRDEDGLPIIPQNPSQDLHPNLRPNLRPATMTMMHQPNRALARAAALLENNLTTISSLTTKRVQISCDLTRASCRHHAALRRDMIRRQREEIARASQKITKRKSA